jgi:hypothetical protein
VDLCRFDQKAEYVIDKSRGYQLSLIKFIASENRAASGLNFKVLESQVYDLGFFMLVLNFRHKKTSLRWIFICTIFH